MRACPQELLLGPVYTRLNVRKEHVPPHGSLLLHLLHSHAAAEFCWHAKGTMRTANQWRCCPSLQTSPVSGVLMGVPQPRALRLAVTLDATIDITLPLLQVHLWPGRDYGDTQPVEVLPFTSDIAGFKRFVGGVTAIGGGDAAEDVFSGLEAAQGLEWGAGSRILVHVADAPCHGYPDFHDMVRFKDLPSSLLSSSPAINSLPSLVMCSCDVGHQPQVRQPQWGGQAGQGPSPAAEDICGQLQAGRLGVLPPDQLHGGCPTGASLLHAACAVPADLTLPATCYTVRPAGLHASCCACP